jgi:thiol-disulfide isomerase/thioredoxin
MTKKNQKYYILGGVAVLLLVGSFFVSNYYSNKPGNYDEFATCIANSGAKFYGAFWCPHCQAQKALFGKSKQYLPYVECSNPDMKTQTPICDEKKIEGYPTWEYQNGTTTIRTSGEKTFQELSEMSGCALPN